MGLADRVREDTPMIDRIFTLPVFPEPRKRPKGYGGRVGFHEGNSKLGGRWMGEGNNRRFLPHGVHCAHADDCELCPLPDGCHYQPKNGKGKAHGF